MNIATIKELRNAFADYVRSEGCSCCQDTKKHDKAARRLGTLLRVEPYADGSGFDFTKYRTPDTDGQPK